MNPKIILGLALVLSAGLFACSSVLAQPAANQDPAKSGSSPAVAGVPAPPAINQDLTEQISAILLECQKIKPGMTRAELLKVFTEEGGLSNAKQRTYVYRGCPYIQVDVIFTLSDSKQNVLEERPTDTISKISQPYLEWMILD